MLVFLTKKKSGHKEIEVDSYLNKLFNLIKSSNELSVLLNPNVFYHIESCIKKSFWSQDNKRYLIKILEDYINFSRKLLSQSINQN